MSWYIKQIGTPANVRATVAHTPHMPVQIQETVNTFCGAVGEGEMLSIESEGHLGACGSKLKLSLEAVTIATDPTAEKAGPN